MKKFTKIMIAGAGNLGSQIAWQTAFSGFEVQVYDVFAEGLEKSKAYHKQYAQLFESRGVEAGKIQSTFDRLSYTTDLAEAAKGADLVSESVPESIEIKTNFYEALAKVAEEKTIFTTNSSTTIPSMYAAATGRPEKFLALHFANGIWDQNIAEIMGHAGTDQAYVKEVEDFSVQIGMEPILIHKEQPGYVLNSLLVPLLMSATDLFMNEVADAKAIDTTWKIGTKAQLGPMYIIDMIGMETMYNVSKLMADQTGDPQMQKRADFYKNNFLDKGIKGASTGKGFYEYK